MAEPALEERDGENYMLYVQKSLEDEENFHFLKFGFLHRLNITQLGVKLVRLKSRIHRNSKATPDDLTLLQTSLRDYATAIRDYRFMRSQKDLTNAEMLDRKQLMERFFMSPDDFKDPFYSHYAFFRDADEGVDPLRAAVMSHLPVSMTYSLDERRQRRKEYEEGMVPKQVSKFVDRLVRLAVSLTGGLFLVGPMLIMSLGPTQTKSLVTVSVAVLLFALGLSFAVRVSNVETLVATATYAAVLVVFVGTSAGSGSS